ncbi:hypothetical protein EB077_11290 [bacterium]|nr:hypothetical protein [bacterium]
MPRSGRELGEAAGDLDLPVRHRNLADLSSERAEADRQRCAHEPGVAAGAGRRTRTHLDEERRAATDSAHRTVQADQGVELRCGVVVHERQVKVAATKARDERLETARTERRCLEGFDGNTLIDAGHERRDVRRARQGAAGRCARAARGGTAAGGARFASGTPTCSR